MQYIVNSDRPTKLNDCQDSKKDVSIVRERPMKCYPALIHMIQPAYQHRLSTQITEENHKKVVPAMQTLVTLESRQFAIYVTEQAPPIPRGLKTVAITLLNESNAKGVNTNILTCAIEDSMNRKIDRPDMTISVYQACAD